MSIGLMFAMSGIGFTLGHWLHRWQVRREKRLEWETAGDMTIRDRVILRESARIKAVARGCRSRIHRLTKFTAFLRASLRGPPCRYGEVRISGVDSGAMAAFLAGVLLMVGALLVATLGAYVLAAVAP